MVVVLCVSDVGVCLCLGRVDVVYMCLPAQQGIPHIHLAPPQPLPLWQKAAAGLTAGGLGALVGSPADLTLIRMQADSTLPPDQRRNYKGVVDAMVRTVKEDGVVGLFRGGGPTVVRAMALNMGMLASNDQVRMMCVGVCALGFVCSTGFVAWW